MASFSLVRRVTVLHTGCAFLGAARLHATTYCRSPIGLSRPYIQYTTVRSNSYSIFNITRTVPVRASVITSKLWQQHAVEQGRLDGAYQHGTGQGEDALPHDVTPPPAPCLRCPTWCRVLLQFSSSRPNIAPEFEPSRRVGFGVLSTWRLRRNRSW